MSLYHAQANCWCGEKHTPSEVLYLNLRKITEVEILSDHTEDCPGGDCNGECWLPTEALKEKARQRTCGDPECYWDEHLKRKE